jgi:DHA1 family bicyclomycin/chloramphenicol resistance-like MFS transporter
MSSSVEPLTQSRPYALTWIMLLGLLTALGPLSIDMYLPALPSMGQAFGVSLSAVSNTVPAYFLGLAIGQLIYGPVSDRFGRKPPLYFGLSLFVLASVVCALSSNIESLLAARVLQALGGCVGVVVARSAIRDRLSPAASSQAYATLLLVMGVAPILAPLAGGWLLQWGWQSIFWVLAAIGALALLMIHLQFDETLAPQNRRPLALGLVLRGYVDLFKDARFRTPALAGGFLMGGLFVYISASSAVLMGHFGVSAQAFGWLFGMNAAGLIALSQVNGRLVRRYSLLRLLQVGTAIQVVGVLLLLVLTVLQQVTLPLLMLCLFAIVSGIGLSAPNSTALALASQGQRAGMASALLGSLQFGLGLLGGVILHTLPFDQLTAIAVMMAVLIGAGALAVWVHSQRQTKLSVL